MPRHCSALFRRIRRATAVAAGITLVTTASANPKAGHDGKPSSRPAEAASAPASGGSVGSKVKGAAVKAQDAVVHGAHVAASGVERGLQAAGGAIDRTAKKIGLPGGESKTESGTGTETKPADAASR